MRKKVLWISGLFLLLLVLLVGLFHTPFVKVLVLKHVQKTLAQSFNLSLSAQSLDYNLFTLRVSLKKPTAGTYDKSTVPPFFSADELIFRLTPALILGKRIDISDIRVVNPRVNLQVNQDGTINIPAQLFQESEGPAPPLLIRRLGIEKGHLTYQDPTGKTEVDIPGINLSGTFIDHGKQEIFLQVNAGKTGPGLMVYQDKRFRLEKMGISARLDKKDIHITLVGTELRGNDTIGINGRLKWDSQEDNRRDDRRLSTVEFRINAAGGEISGKSQLYFPLDTPITDKSHPHHITLSWKAINLQTPLITTYFPHSIYSGTSGSLDMEVTDFSINGVRGNAEIKLMPLKTSAAKADLVPLAGKVSVHLEPGIISLRDFSLSSPVNGLQQNAYTRVNGNFLLKNRQFQGELYGSFQGQPVIDGHLRWSGQIWEDLSNPRFQVRLEGNGIRLDNRMLIVPRGNLEYKNRQLKTRDLGIRIMGTDELFLGQVGVSGIFPLETPLPGQPNPLNIVINARDISMGQLITYFKSDFPVRGTLSAQAHILPQRIDADILLTDGIYGIPGQEEVVPGNINGRFQLVNNRLNYQLRAPELSIEITGTGRVVPPYPLQSTVFIDIPDIHNLSQRQGFEILKSISGNITGQVNVGLDLENMLDTVRLEANIEKFLIRTWEKELENQEPLRITLDSGGITIDSLKLKGPGTHIQANGFLPLFKRSYELKRGLGEEERVFSKKAPLTAGSKEEITVSAQIDPVLLNPFIAPYRLSGSLLLRTGISGSLTDPVLSSELTLNKFSINEENGPNSRLEGRMEISGNVKDLRQLKVATDLTTLDIGIPGFPSLHSSKPVKLRLQNGRLQVEQLLLADESDRAHLDVSGFINLLDTQWLDLRVIGQLDARLVGSYLEEIQLTGKNSLDIRIGGELQKPEISGSLDLQNIEMRYIDPDVYINQLNGKLRLTSNRIQLESLNGNLNGGSLSIDGDITYETSGIRAMEIKLTAKDSHFEYPQGLFSEVSGGLTLSFDNRDYLLKGSVDIREGVYKAPFNVMSEIFTYIRGTPAAVPVEEADTFLNRLNLDIGLRTSSPLLINNNVSRSELTADLFLRGAYNYPALSGRLTVKEGGEIYLGNNKYLIERGIINFVNPYRMEPDLNIRARTKAQDYDIVLDLSGTPETLKASFTSTPTLSEPNIISLLATGQTLESVSGSLLDTTGSQALSYIGSTFSGKIQQFAKQKLGIDQVRIDGSFIASKNNPGARLTVGQRLTSNLELTLSQDLKQAQNSSWILEYAPFSNVTIQGVKQDNEQYSAALLHDIRFRLGSGGSGDSGNKSTAAKKSRSKFMKIEDIHFTGDTGIPRSTLYSTVKLKKGKTFNYFRFQADLERLRNLYLKNNYPWTEIKPNRQEENGKTTITYSIIAGPKIFLEFHGANFPNRFRKKLKKLWSEGQFAQQSTKNVIQALCLYFFKKGYCQVKVNAGTPEKTPDNVFRYPFTIEKGVKYRQVRFLFPGSRLISRKRLYGFLKAGQLKWLAFLQPNRVVRELSQYYRNHGFLTAQCQEPGIGFFPLQEKVIVTIPVEEGPLFKIGQINFTGIRLLDEETLLNTISIKKNQVFSPLKFNEVKYEIAAAYARKGFNDVRINSLKQIKREKGVVDLEFGIEENLQGIIREITISGNSLTRTSVIRRELSFKEGDLLDFQEINKSRKKLYDLGIFKRVNIEAVPLNTPQEKDARKDFRVMVQLSELKPFRLKTGVRWDTEKALGVLAELENPNIAGQAHYLGASFSLDDQETNLKTYYRFPYFLGKKIATEFFVFTGKEKKPAFTVNRSGLTLQQQLRKGKTLVFSWNYTRERTHTILPPAARGDSFYKNRPPWTPSQKFFVDDAILNLAHLTVAFSCDRRNSLVDPTRGFFSSASFQYAARFLGSDANFSRFFSECHWYVPYRRFLVSATSLRIGLGKGLGQENLPGERFFAGGGNTIRGFKLNMVGSLDQQGNPLGGEALFIFKQELRLRLHNLVSVVLFTDLGNVYDTIEEFNMFNLRKSAGFGIRIHTDMLLLRFDWGFLLDRQPGESPSRIFISIGQAF